MPFYRRLMTISIALILIFSLLAGCDNNLANEPEDFAQEDPTSGEVVDSGEGEETEDPDTEAEPKEVEPAFGGSEGEEQTWLVMLYQDADDEVLEKDIYIDLNEAEMVGSTNLVTVVSQMDRMDGGYDGGDDWTTTKRFLVLPDKSGDLETLASEELEDLGEVDMGSKDSLVDFATWAISSYPADRYVLILSDHGAGWTGGWTDNDPNEGSQLWLNDIDEALAEIVDQSGIGQFELIGFDACLMSQIDVLSAIAPYARYAVGSEETEPSLGWAYSAFLNALNENPAMDGAELGRYIVDSYIVEDWRLTDPAALEDFANDLRAPGATAEQIAGELGGDITLTAIDLARLGSLNEALNELVLTLQDVDQSAVAEARAYAQSYTSIFGEDTPPAYIDLGSFAGLLMETFGEGEVYDAAYRLVEAIEEVTIAEKHGDDRPGSTGVTLYFPNGDLYELTNNPEMVAHYLTVSGRFVAASLWDDFLAFHYASNPIDPGVVDASVLEPNSRSADFSRAIQASSLAAGTEIVRPGAGEVDFTNLSASAESIKVQDVLTLSAELTGKNVGYIYLYTAYYDPESDSYLTTDLDFVGTENAKQVDGLSYPDWGDDPDMSMEIEWEPVVWTISDGETDAIAAAEAETYGETAESTFYRVWGTYQFAGSAQKRDAFLRFDANGKLVSVTVFSGSEHNAAPREIVPAAGDSFTVDQEWLEFDQNPDGEYAYYEGDTVTFGDAGFEMLANEAMPGSYVIGLIVEDLEGQTFEQYVDVEVTE